MKANADLYGYSISFKNRVPMVRLATRAGTHIIRHQESNLASQ
jgi:hypothetical protein